MLEKKLVTHQHNFYNFVSRENYILENLEYWSVAKVSVYSSTEPRIFLPLQEFCVLIIVYHIHRDVKRLFLICGGFSYL